LKKFSIYIKDKKNYFLKLTELENKTINSYLSQDIKVDIAKYYSSLTSKIDENYYPKVLTLIDTILSKRENPNAKAEAETIKSNILKKELAITIPSKIYPNQNYRAYIKFKNIDTLKVSYFKIPLPFFKQIETENKYFRNNNLTSIDRENLVLEYIKKNKPLLNTVKTLPPNLSHFEYTTEILMDNLDTGLYFMFFETKNAYDEIENAFAYKTIQVSNIEFVEDQNNDFDKFYVLDRKTGKPLENVIVKNNTETQKSNKIGEIKLATFKKSEENTLSDLIFINGKDTLSSYYYNNNKIYTNKYEKFEAKAMVFFDRAIYRPGQKVFFKGYMFQNKNNVKSVVPNLTVHVIVNDANEDEVKTFDIQTNEFGSFTGEYEIPKNVLTGKFYITIEEPENLEVDTKYYNKKEDEHSFWDTVDYDEYNEFSFNVEEYKRPTFEITFDNVTENYTIGDTIKIKGNAKSLAGSNLTNAKIEYTITRNVVKKNQYYDENENDIFDETTTDENGNFKIEFVATSDNILASELEEINFTIETEITDSNGETRTASKSLIVGQKMLKLNCFVAPKLFKEEKNTLKINATTLNNHPINAKGTITFIEQNRNHYLINRVQYPELQTINKTEFQKLFPFEAYDLKDIEIVEKKIKTISFDTEKSNIVDLDFLQNFEAKNYKIVVEAKDQKGNDITTESTFELSSQKKLVSNEKLFTFKSIETDKNNFIFEINSIIPDLYITSRLYANDKEVEPEVVQLKNGYALVKFPKEKTYTTDVDFHFSTFWENNYFMDKTTINTDEIETSLDFEIVSMRNKIEPGSNENWSFIIKNSKFQSEVLASMYDTSLDQFLTTNWRKTTFYKHKTYPTVFYRNYDWYENTIYFNNLHFKTKYYKTYTPNPELNWFGFNFNNYSKYSNEQYLKKVNTIASIPKDAKKVYGIVSDKLGPLPGANVVVHGTTRGTQTNFDGYYEIDLESGEQIKVSFTGYKSVTVKYEKEKNLNITLEEGAELQEVVVVAYRTEKKFALTGSVSVVKDEDFLTDLKVQLANGTGMPGDGNTIRIRGIGSVDNLNSLLYVIDGVPVTGEDIVNLNYSDITSATILKDASASALYGSRGANGVVIINTKKGIQELEQIKTRTNFNETAFFFPSLTTDAKGNINFSFTSPESLTKWRLRMFAHNKKAETGYFQTDIISQKDVMVMPNMPRFVREKDVITLTSKVVNMTNESLSGNVALLLFDAATNEAIDTLTMNSDNIKPFNCKSKQSVAVNWTITIPEGIQGLRYKVIAKSGNVSDGEENILPVLTDKILLTESLPIWVKGNTKRDFTLENLKNNTSPTLQNHALTLEYTSNPIWIALQSLPYLMTYEHDCTEQTFSKYYANFIAEKIITSNTKIEQLFQKWHNSKSVENKLTMNEELKSVVLAETPWLLDAETEDEKNKRLAVLMELNTLKSNNDKSLKSLEEKMLPSGGFPWFSGGTENRYITQHILAGIGHLNKLYPNESSKHKTIVDKAIPNLDEQFVSLYSKSKKISKLETVNINYLYTRSFYLTEYPLSKKCDSIIQLQLKNSKENWLTYSLYEKGLLALVMNRFNEKSFAKKIIESLKETTSNNDEIGMYWIENKSGYYWYQSKIETQALLIEAFAEIDNNKELIDAMKVWLIKNKQTNKWPTTKATTEAIFALLNHGNDWTSLKENTKITLGDEKTLTKKLEKKEDELDTGYLKIQFKSYEISPKMATITVNNKTASPGFGGVYWQYFETLENIKKDSTQAISITKNLFKKVKTNQDKELIALEKEQLKVGDLITVRLIIKTDNNLEFVHLKDLRASCLEPVDVISEYKWESGYSYYKSTKDVATHFFFDKLNKGTYVLEYDLRVTNNGTFNNGISTLQSMYAPEFSSHSENIKIQVVE
jgi:TonB-dependent SusC/RagA subfamily outer membrane receptor